MRYHFSGIAGAGVNPLARLVRAWGHDVQGSDRGFDRGQQAERRQQLEAEGIRIVAQDGAAITPAIDCMIYSTAVEQDTPELVAARRHGVALVPRPALLAEIVNAAQPGIAISGTAGKSTITGMVAWCLRQLGQPATILGGAALVGDDGPFTPGPAGGLVVAEACESDGTLPGYQPAIGLIHNITRDHGEVDEVKAQFEHFAARSQRLLVNAACPVATALAAQHPRAVRYGTGDPADLPLEIVSIGPWRSQGVLGLPEGDINLDLPQPGAHTLDNAAAALAVIRCLGLDVSAAAAALREFPGVVRRFQVLGTTDTGITVVDDYAHNGDKIRAAVEAAQAGCDRLVAVFQPHGFGPAKFLRPELKTLLPSLLRPQDRFCYAGIHYAGGTVAKDISSADLVSDLPANLAAAHAPDHAAVLAWVADTAIPGDTVLLMGARDPALPGLAKALYGLL
ncbi:UDP-N-acetylmuramate--L-alanine ligase [Planctomycetota bacterium]|nr:UDP-N-acetylmuramate--L-alanine ligase [Planctomycetota bacterium]